jgi:hypothetical protein
MTVNLTKAPQSVTPYAAAKIVNAALLEAGVDRQLPPQMFYNYTTARVSKGKAPLIPTVEVDGKVQVSVDGLTGWLQKYITKAQTTAIAEETVAAE